MRKLVFPLVVLLFLTTANIAFAQNGVLNKIAGGGTTLGDGGLSVNAKLIFPTSLAIDKYGNIYITDHDDYRIRKVTASGTISTVAGNGTQGSIGDGGLAVDAELDTLTGIAVDNNKNIYFANGCRIRKVDSNGIVTTIAGGACGYSGDGGPAVSAQIKNVNKIAVDTSGNLYLGDCANNRIRKISTAGIITTVAGTGSSGFGGDGGPATSADISTPYGLTLDKAGNIYFSDWGNNRIRKVDNTGIISTIAGIGTSGFSGDGAAATLAEFSGAIDVVVDGTGNVFVADHGNYRVRKINAADGTINTVAGTGVSGSTFYGYAASSGIDPYGMIMDNLSNLYFCDEVGYAFRIQQTASFQFFYDINSNCIWDTTETAINLPFLIAVDSNGFPMDTLSSFSGFSYNTRGNVGDIYTFTILDYSSALTPSCAGPLIFSDTINSLNGNYFNKNVGFKCSGTTLDLAVNAVFSGSGYHAHSGRIFVSNLGCFETPAVVTVNVSDLYTYFSAAYPSPSSVFGNTITWNISDLAATRPGVELEYAMRASPYDAFGELVRDTVTITPVTGDSNPLNNTLVIYDTVKSGFDPNEMSVTPAGCIASNASTTLTYTINFENTGNDTAFNIFVIDTLSDDLDQQSFRILSASATMNSIRSYINGHSVMQFAFPNINLLDSSHHGLCDGMLQYTINTYNGLPAGATIFNEAGIFFDNNPVVTTNTVEDVIGGCYTTSVSNTLQPLTENVRLYPNPAASELTIKMIQNAYATFTITNSIGQQLIQQPLTGSRSTVNVSALPAGLYYITFRGDNGTEVRKFVKE